MMFKDPCSCRGLSLFPYFLISLFPYFLISLFPYFLISLFASFPDEYFVLIKVCYNIYDVHFARSAAQIANSLYMK